MSRKIQFFGAIILGAVLYLFDALSTTYSAVFCLLLILLVGIPHGAVDHKIHQTTSKDKNLIKYIITYLIIAAGYVLWWLIDPAKALFIFILLSAYHFGQELLEDKRIGKYFNSLTDSMIWGSSILIGPMFFSLHEINSYIEIVAGYALSFPSPAIPFAISALVYGITFGHLILLVLSKKASSSDAKELFLFTIINIFLHFVLDFIVAFSVYFVIFHSLNAFKHQFEWLSRIKRDYSVKKFIIDLSLFGILAVVGIVLIIFILKPATTESVISVFFILISLITLPHAITLDQFYKVRE